MVSVSFSSDQLEDTVVWFYNKATPEWTEGQIHIRSHMVEEKYADWNITIMGVKPGDMAAFIAIDDFAFHPTDICETKPVDAGEMTTTTTSKPCTSDEFTCDDGSCVPLFRVCDFVFDCDDATDEEQCPSVYNFEQCSVPGDCYWDVLEGDGLEWVIGTGNEVSDANKTHGPYAGTDNNTYNHFLYVNPLPNSNKGYTGIASPLYQNSASECYFTFFVYLNDWDPPNHPKLLPMISHNDIGQLSQLDEIDLSFVSPGVWTKVEIGIGRHRDHFKLLFNIDNVAEENIFKAGVAVDTVNLFGCAPPPPQDECQLSVQFQCEVTHGCIPKTKICDLQDDCGDNSDEVEGCLKYHPQDFEDPENPLGFFTQDQGDDFRWGSFNGSTGYRGTGPAFDHTFFQPKGHYLMIPSLLGLPGDFAWLWTPVIGPAGRTCVMRFFSHMHGRGVGNLTVYIRTTSDGSMDAIHHVNGIEIMDVNRWKRNEVELVSEMEFQVIIEATVGSPGDSDIAIDDVTFTPECK